MSVALVEKLCLELQWQESDKEVSLSDDPNKTSRHVSPGKRRGISLSSSELSHSHEGNRTNAQGFVLLSCKGSGLS